MANKLYFGKDARLKLAEGANKLADAVTATLGPGGREVIIQTPWGSPYVTKDGVTVAKAITVEDPLENLGAMLLKEAAIRTNDTAGDGTTTATLLAQSMYQAGLKVLEGDVKANPVYLRRGIEKAVQAAVKELENLSREVKDGSEIRNVALISSNHDEEIAGILDLAINGGAKQGDDGKDLHYTGVGPQGVITVKEGKTHETSVEFVEGYEFDRGFQSGYFITDPARGVAELQRPAIFLYDGKMSLQDVVKILETGLNPAAPSTEERDQRSYVFIANEFEEQALAALVINKMKGVVNAVAVKAPGFGDRRKQLLEDIALATRGQVISQEKGDSIEKMQPAQILALAGGAKEVIVGKDATTLLNSYGESSAIEKRVKQLETENEKTTSDYDQEKLQERIAKLTGKVAVISVGAYTELEMKERKYRVEDALHATRAASTEGIVPGGGIAYLRLGQKLDDLAAAEKETSVREGMQIVADSLKRPAYQIAKNAGADADAVLGKVSGGKTAFGYDALQGEYGDLFERGIIDPTLVVRSAIENAASVAVHLLNAECAVTLIPEKEKGPATPDVE